jgi:hypothetical protein
MRNEEVHCVSRQPIPYSVRRLGTSWKVRFSNPDKGKRVSLLRNVQTGSLPFTQPLVQRVSGSFPGGKLAGD